MTKGQLIQWIRSTGSSTYFPKGGGDKRSLDTLYSSRVSPPLPSSPSLQSLKSEDHPSTINQEKDSSSHDQSIDGYYTLQQHLHALVGPDEMLACALSLSEYSNIPHQAATEIHPSLHSDHDACMTLVYVEKVDSTGDRLPPVSLTPSNPMLSSDADTRLLINHIQSNPKLGPKDLLSLYIKELSARIRAKKTLSSPPHTIRIYLCARPQPEYLFPASASHPGKRILSELDLAKWWMDALSRIAEESAPLGVSSRGYWFVPGETEQSMQKLKKGQSTAVTWTFGLPYQPSADARTCIPLLPDDPMTKLVEAQAADGPLTVHQVMELLSFSGECGAGRIATFFVLDLTLLSDSKKADDVKLNDPATTQISSIKIKSQKYSNVKQHLEALDFSSTAVNRASTSSLLDTWSSTMSVVRVPVELIESPPALVRNGNSADKSGLNNIAFVANPVLNNAQSLVKKKKRKDVEDNLPPVNIQQFVKRKA